MDMREGLKQSCDVYFYEVARKLGIDRLSETAKKFGLGEKVLDGFIEERTGVVPNTSWKKKVYWKKLVSRRNITCWYRTRILAIITDATMFNDSSNCKWWL